MSSVPRAVLRYVSLLFSIALVASACGGGADASETTVIEATTTVVTTPPPVTAGPATDTEEPTTGGPTGDSLCAIDLDSAGTTVAVTGVVVSIDELAAGALVELEAEGCISLIWIAQADLDTWSDAQREALTAGGSLTLGGVVAERDGNVVVEVVQGPDLPPPTP